MRQPPVLYHRTCSDALRLIAATLPQLIPGEEELGPQMRCRRCRDWFPADVEFWVPRDDGWYLSCRACRAELRAGHRGRRRVTRGEGAG